MIAQTNKSLICAWLSRHTPTVNQAASLREYEIVQVDPKRRFPNANAAWRSAYQACQRAPDLFVVVLPEAWIVEFVALVHFHTPNVPVLRARMLPPDYERWSGEWRALDVRGSELDWYQWKPEVLR